jgi:aryl-alcohol dehydrogenase-like predicted oxidoreductase
MNEPIWPGCISASDDAWKAWLAERQVVNFAWSSQGRGFFTGAAGPDKRDNDELVRVWYSKRNFARRARAVELAEQLGMKPIHVALAYCLHQPFPVVPLIGPRRLVELDDSLRALDITLTPEQVHWLEAG